MNETEIRTPVGFARLGRAGAILGLIGAALLIVGLLTLQGDPVRVKNLMQSYLYGWVLAMLLSLGCYGFMLVHYMSRGSWGIPVIRLFEAGAKSLPLMFVLFLPIMIWCRDLYPWANPDLVYGNAALGLKPDEVLLHKAGYLNPTMFFIRTVGYFGIWFIFTSVLTRQSLLQDKDGDIRRAIYRQKLSSFGFVIYVLTTTLAFTDWIMSLDAHWFSTIYGFWFMDFQGLAALAFVSLIVTTYKLSHKEPYESLVNPQLTRDLGNLMLTLTMIWAYFSLSQWIIIWSGNLPEEITFYLKRNSGTFLLVGAANILLSFFAPFVALLSGHTKRSPGLIARVAILILVMRTVDVFWAVVPATRHPIALLASDVAGALFAIGVFLAAFSYWVSRAPIIPRHEELVAQEVTAHAG